MVQFPNESLHVTPSIIIVIRSLTWGSLQQQKLSIVYVYFLRAIEKKGGYDHRSALEDLRVLFLFFV